MLPFVRPGAQVASGAQVMSVAPVPAGDGSLLVGAFAFVVDVRGGHAATRRFSIAAGLCKE